jgi:hypothetical protein
VGATRAAPPAEGPVEAPPKPVPANDVAEPAASRAQGESNAPPVQGAAAPDPKAARVAELRRVRASNEEQINTLEGQRQTHEERRLKYQKQADELLGTTRNRNNPEYRNKMRQMNNEATLRNGVQDEINRLIGGNDRINQQVADILRPPAATPQQAGRDMETLITQQSGFPKNATKHSTSFPDASAPDGSRIPDYMPEPDGKGGWKSAARPEDALCVADSKQVAGTLPLSEQIKGFTELAARTKLRTLWIIAGPTTRIHDEIKVFAAKYGVQVFVTRQ